MTSELQADQNKMLLVGDNPFHGISHLSQERVKNRGKQITTPEYAANLVAIALQNGAQGFMFSVSDNTLSIIERLSQNKVNRTNLFALVPYAYEYVRAATHAGGVPGLARNLAAQIAKSGNFNAAASGLKGVLLNDPIDLLKAYLHYEISRIKSSAGKTGILRSVMMHEILTDMALALDLERVFRVYIEFMQKQHIQPGFESRNFAFLVNRFEEWGINLSDCLIAAPFNSMGFYMNPSKVECEKALSRLPRPNVIAMSVLAAGYLKPSDALRYVSNLRNISGVVVGVSNEEQARAISVFLGKERTHE